MDPSKSSKRPVPLVNETSTLRRHMQATHKAKYCEWAVANGFTSMLPNDMKRRHTEAMSSVDTQPTLGGYMVEKGQVVQYSDSIFREAAILWLIETDQPIHTLQHPAFQKMVDIASRAKNSVKIPSRGQTRQAIIDSFKTSLLSLHKCFSVRKQIS
ncbi:hypothetical protein EDD15DRAFT_2162769 [Pisolithus albus]|nr:hypothetical protein EDD15DRAFT_2162769 [Pisolithus albus]